MRINASQQLRLEQQMRLSPRMIQAMEILQLPVMALQERIETELQSNPVLEMSDLGVDSQAPPAQDSEVAPEQPLVLGENGSGQEDFQRLADFESEYEPFEAVAEAGPRYVEGDRDRKLDAMANAPAPAETLEEYLTKQWAFIEVPPQIKQAGLLIISRIEEDGYLRSTLEEIAKQANPENPTPSDVMQQALKLVQALDPLGVGARDLRECLLLQLAAEEAAGGDMSLERLLVERYLHDVELNRLPAIAKRTEKTVDQIKAAIENLSHLNPRPGLLVGSRPAPIITPDIIVDIDENGEIVIRMPDDNTPPLHISKAYQRLASDRKTAPDAKQFLIRNIRSAQWIIDAIHQRRQTVQNVAREVFKYQRDFVFQGPEAMKPLPMAHVAKRVRVHVATVSRAVAGKHVQTPWGIFPLRSFFSSGTTTDSGEDVSWDAIKMKLKQLVAGEDKSSPLDDETLAKMMQEQGIKIARRTVAKYRDMLEIPSARKRKQY